MSIMSLSVLPCVVHRPTWKDEEDEELKVVRDERKLSLTIPGEEHHHCKVQFAPRGSCQL